MDARLTFEGLDTRPPVHSLRVPSRALREQVLPFTIRTVSTNEELRKAVEIRARAYGRHVPALGEQLRKPETLDTSPGCVVFLAESKLDGEPIGTMRVQTNLHDALPLEHSVRLPDWLQNRRLAQASRLGVQIGRVGSAVKIALFKAYYLYCREASIDWAVIAARSPLDRMYEALRFQDVFPGELVRLPLAGNLPHRIMAVEVDALERQWSAASHPLHEFFFGTEHADIDVQGAPQASVEELAREQVPVAQLAA